MRQHNDNEMNKGFENIQSNFSMLDNVVGQNRCDRHDVIYNLIETPGGIVGSCPACFKARIEEEDKGIIDKAIENHNGWQASYIDRFERVTSDLKDAKVSTYKPNHNSQEQAKRMVIKYIKTFSGEKTLVLSGRPGLGKSHLAYAITKALRLKKYKTWFIKTTELLDLFKSTYRDGSQLTEERIFELIESIDLLVLDDTGSEYVKASDMGHETWASDILYKVFDLRLNKALVCTTNYSEMELEKKYGYNGERIVSRMMDNAQGIRLQGDDQRRKNRF